MELEVVRLDESTEHLYSELLSSCSWSMFYHSLKYRRLLKQLLPDAKDYYLLALQGGRVVGALPAFVRDGPFGPILNSTPFFGSHGGVVLHPDADAKVVAALVDALLTLCQAQRIAMATVIDTPFFSCQGLFTSERGFRHGDVRIGQITMLPSGESTGDTADRLLAVYHQKTRNIVRKALRSGLTFGHESKQEVLAALHRLHHTNIVGIGGVPKPMKFFELVANVFEYDTDYRIYTARTAEGEIVCAMLIFYYRDTVEYFVPATAEDWRVAQPLSALIHLAMCDSIQERHAKIWNWGGTWLSQDGVYHFKSRWGTSDHQYRYYTRLFFDELMLKFIDRETLQSGYPFFYSLPFSLLK